MKICFYNKKIINIFIIRVELLVPVIGSPYLEKLFYRRRKRAAYDHTASFLYMLGLAFPLSISLDNGMGISRITL